MSDALKYLMQIRPEAMESYFSFVKKSGVHLDEKTKAIISVITKVDKQTEKGFKQYLKRALNAGVSPDEIIDALFVAFPSLGLSKIVWAIDVLLGMDIPAFQLENMQSTPQWQNVIEELRLKPGVSFVKDCDGRDLFIYHNDENTNVYDNICPHQSTAISELGLDGLVLTCHLHKWSFDIKTGKCREKGDKSLKIFESKLENGFFFALW